MTPPNGNSVIWPAVVMSPILEPYFSVNHTAPSGPAAIRHGPLLCVGIGNSVTVPDVVMRPIVFATNSVNHSAPSRPATIPLGPPGVGSENSRTSPAVVMALSGWPSPR